MSHVHKITNTLDDEEGGGAVQTGGDLVHEQCIAWTHQLLSCTEIVTSQFSLLLKPCQQYDERIHFAGDFGLDSK